MTSTIERRAPKVRCYECGSPDVQALCHHCWRPGCVRHVVRSPAWARWLTGAEGSGPGLKKVRGCHCADCRHVRADGWLGTGAAGLALVIAGLSVLPASLVIGAGLAAAGIAMVLVACLGIRRRSAKVRAGLPVALHPKVSDVQTFERLRTQITLSADGEYRLQLHPVKGKLSAELTFGESDRDRVNRYSRKRGVKPDQKVPWTVGCLVLHGWVAIKEANISRGVEVAGDDAAAILGLRQQDAPVSRRGNVALDYTLLKPPEIKAGPFWVTPSIAPGSEKHVLELDIQWPKIDPEDENPPLLSLINLLRIEVPVKWGRVQEIDRGSPTVSAPSSDGGEWTRSIEWKQFSPSRAERKERQLTITVRFANPISAEHDLSGRLAATFNGSLSGVKEIGVFNALGNSRPLSVRPSVRTRVEADFKLSLASVRYQATRVFPDPETEDVDHSRSTADFDVIPDGEAIISLSNSLAENQFYVKRITENPPRSGGRADVLHRYWNIAGRSYEGVHPTNFDITITGEEVHRGDVRPESGNTKIRISVSGAYTNGDMRDRVDDTWSRLKELTAEAVEKARNSTARGPE